MSYKVVMNDVQSPEYTIHVFDPAAIKNLRLTYKFPKYMEKPDKNRYRMDGTVEALEGTTVDITLVASSPLRDGKLSLSNGKNYSDDGQRSEVTGTIAVEKTAITRCSRPIRTAQPSLPRRVFQSRRSNPRLRRWKWSIPALIRWFIRWKKLHSPAKVESTIGLKEVRLHSYYNNDPEEVQRIACRGNGGPAMSTLAEFTVDLEKRSNVHAGDTILFHFESEDMKGQLVSSDVYAVTVRALESFIAYGYTR